MDQLQIRAKFPSIPSENLESFKRVATQCTEVVREKDPGTSQYDWFFSPDGSQCVVRETYASSEAMMAHMGNLGDLLGELVELGGELEVEVFGAPSEELQAAAAAFEPAIYDHFLSM
jgi:hypothetical protein